MAVLTVFACLLFALLAIRAWRNRAIKQSKLFPPPLAGLPECGELLAAADSFYVATTFGDSFLERIAAHGLGARGFASIEIFAEGVLVKRVGERNLAIVARDLVSVSYSQVAIDKAVEKDGLLVMSWNAGDSLLATHIRIKDALARDQIFSTLSGLVSRGVKK